MGLWQEVRDRHESLKKRIHAFRVPLSPRGQMLMTFVYFSIPLTGGYYWMQWAQGRAEINLREAGVTADGDSPRAEERDSKTKVQNELFKKYLRKLEKKWEREKGESQGG
ncbi:unnamed protein product [Discosporangium mesarthrocarpum]